MRWFEILKETTSVTDQARSAILDILTPLQSQGVSSLTVQQVLDQLRSDPNFQGIQLDDDFIQQALQDVSGVTVAPDTANNGVSTITLDPSAPTTTAAQKQATKGQNTIDQAAQRTIDKDLGT